MSNAQSSLFLSPREIAAWQIPSVLLEHPKVHAELPRSSVVRVAGAAG